MASNILYPSSNTYSQISFLDVNDSAISSTGNILSQIKQEAFFFQTTTVTATSTTYVTYNLNDYPGCSGVIVNSSVESTYAGSVANNYMTLNTNHYFVRTIVSGSGTSAFLSTFNIDNASQVLTTGASQEDSQILPTNLANIIPLTTFTGATVYNASTGILNFRMSLRSNTTYYIKGITTFI